MTPQGQKYLFDIQRAIKLIDHFVLDTPTFDTYQADLKNPQRG